MSNPSYWVYEGSRRRPGELASDPALLPDNASPLYRPPPSAARPPAVEGIDHAAYSLATADPSDFPGLFRQHISGHLGAVERLHDLLSAAATWCLDHDARQYRDELESLANRLSDLGEELHLVNDSLRRELSGRGERMAAAMSRSPALTARSPLPAASPTAGPENIAAAVSPAGQRRIR
ncbi:hypothetical protein OG535_29185 [Kitasatospora sp. NBC_00085]|uniref:hypothetical protein n=1 Tax=Kitasatospora sp. NBC_00085 TaxID=2903566 RepID=UPI0032508DE3